jgi:hypothetical protein
LREVLTAKNHQELHDMRAISDELLKVLREKTGEWGVELMQFNLTDSAPSRESATLVNAEAGVRLRLQALKKGLSEEHLELGELPDMLAATLVGIPLVASVGGTTHVYPRQIPNSAQNQRGFFERLFGSSNNTNHQETAGEIAEE